MKLKSKGGRRKAEDSSFILHPSSFKKKGCRHSQSADERRWHRQRWSAEDREFLHHANKWAGPRRECRDGFGDFTRFFAGKVNA